MISYYPSVVLPFFQYQRSKPHHLGEFFFQSWEDALWHLIDHQIVKKGTILVPNFYCMDVIDNMTDHGLKPVFYPLDASFQPNISRLRSRIRATRPTAVVVFHVAGIESSLTTETSWRTTLPSETVIIHDYVHRIMSPAEINLPTPKDITLDSLRKVTPLSGSRLFVRQEIKDQIPAPHLPHPLYTLRTRRDFIFFRTLLFLGHIFKNQYLIRHAHKKTLQRHDDLIGDSHHGNAGPWLSRVVTSHLATDKIAKIKGAQAHTYATSLQSFSSLHMPARQHEYGDLHAFPVVVSQPVAGKLEPRLDKLNVWSKFPDSPWSRNKRVFFLPLGPHITPQDQKIIIRTIQQALSHGPYTTGGHRQRPVQRDQSTA